MPNWPRRVATVLVCAPTAVWLLLTPPFGALLLLGLLLGCALEYRGNLLPALSREPAPAALWPLYLAPCAAAGVWGAPGCCAALALALLQCVGAHLLLQRSEPTRESAAALALDALGLAYLGGGFAAMVLLGPEWQLFCALVVWNADNGGVVAGSLLGRRPLCPRLSPGKTVEGVAGGALLASATSAAFGGLWWGSWGWRWAVGGVGMALLSVCGDLFVSALKRAGGLKDTGVFFPGHGGCLDRMDSMVPPAVVLLLLLGVTP